MLLQRFELFFDVFDLGVLAGLYKPFVSGLVEFILARTGTSARRQCDADYGNRAGIKQAK